MASVINLNTAVANALHSPKVKLSNGEFRPAYPYKNSSISGIETGAEDSFRKNPEYIEKTKDTYNSPKNIKRIIITYKRVEVEFYMRYRIGGHSGSLWNINNVNNGLTLEIFKRLANINIKDKDTYTGNILSIIESPYSCTNLEEIYIDQSIFLSSDKTVKEIASALFGINGNGLIEQVAKSYFTKVNLANNGKIPNSVIMRLLGGNGVTQENLRSKFPRLARVGIIFNLDSILDNGGRELITSGKLQGYWIDQANSNGLLNNGKVIGCGVVSFSNPRGYFTKKKDTKGRLVEVLPYKLDEKLFEYLSNKTKEENMGEIERLIRNYEESGKSEEEIKKILNIATIGFNKEARLKISNTLSAKYRQKYGNSIEK